MADETRYLTVIGGLVGEVKRLRAEVEKNNYIQDRLLCEKCEELSATAAAQALEAKKVQDGLLKEAFALIGESSWNSSTTPALSQGVNVHGSKRKIGEISATANQPEDEDIEEISSPSANRSLESSIRKRFKTIRQKSDIIGSSAISPNPPLNCNTNSTPAKEMKLQAVIREGDETQAAHRESAERKTVDLMSPSAPSPPKAPPAKKSRDTPRLSRVIDVASNSFTSPLDAITASNVAELRFSMPRAPRSDELAPSVAKTPVVAMTCHIGPLMQHRSQPEAVISRTRLSNKVRVPYIVIKKLEVSTDGIIQLADLFRNYGWLDIKADNLAYYITFPLSHQGRSEGWKMKSEFDGKRLIGMRFSMELIYIGGGEERLRRGVVSDVYLRDRLYVPHLIINKIPTSSEGIAELELLLQHYDWMDIRADPKAYFIIFAEGRDACQEAWRLKADFDGKDFMGNTLRFGHQWIGSKKPRVGVAAKSG